jgi:2'-5' RNA ligase
MSVGAEDLIIIQTLEQVKTGQEFAKIPPHVTVLSWFTLQKLRIDELVETLDELATTHGAEARTMTGLKRVKYGVNEDIPACTLNVATRAIHDSARERVDELGGTYHYPQYAQNWSPHMTDELGISVQPGDEVHFASLALISRQERAMGNFKIVEFSAPLDTPVQTNDTI